MGHETILGTSTLHKNEMLRFENAKKSIISSENIILNIHQPPQKKIYQKDQNYERALLYQPETTCEDNIIGQMQIKYHLSQSSDSAFDIKKKENKTNTLQDNRIGFKIPYQSNFEDERSIALNYIRSFQLF